MVIIQIIEFLILDDCLYDNGWKNDKQIREIFMNGRHWGIMFVLIMQYALGIPPNFEQILIMYFYFVKIFIQ